MTVGTQGFSGRRLREAREVRGLTATALAEAVNVTPAAISQYERAEGASPRAEVLDKLCAILRMPASYFVSPPRLDRNYPVFYRSLSSATKSARTRAENHLAWAAEFIRPYLEEFIDLPPLQFPKLIVARDPAELSSDDIEDYAAEVRRHFQLPDSPIASVTALLESAGAIIIRTDVGSDKLDSFSAWIEGRPCIVVSAEKASAVRYNFDIAHELAHLLLHAHLRIPDVSQPARHKQLEEQAHRFAAAFLLPAKAFASDVFAPTLGTFRNLKAKWRASIGVMIIRCRDLGLINEREENWLWVQYGRRGWRRWEPLDDELEIQVPAVMRSAMELLVDRRVQSPADITAAIPLDPPIIEALSGLRAGFLAEQLAPPVRLKLGLQQIPEPRIINFPER
jgi:Zn-dependent peptidase ImmA (M78 family)/DNA-binding XRE family transcriptional regulator